MPETETEEPDATDTAPLLAIVADAPRSVTSPPLTTAISPVPSTDSDCPITSMSEFDITSSLSLVNVISPPLFTSRLAPADTATFSELSDIESPDIASILLAAATITDPRSVVCPK